MQDRERLIDRIKKLLALASDNTNEAEAKAALDKAYLLMEVNNISLEEVVGRRIRKKDEVKDSWRTTENNGGKAETSSKRTHQAKTEANENENPGSSIHPALRIFLMITIFIVLFLSVSIVVSVLSSPYTSRWYRGDPLRDFVLVFSEMLDYLWPLSFCVFFISYLIYSAIKKR